MKRYPLSSVLTVIITAATVAGCASGPMYQDIKKTGALTPSKGKGMVIVFITPYGIGGNGAGAQHDFYIFANNVPLPGRLPAGCFYSYEVAPGPLNIAASERKEAASAGDEAASGIGGALTAGVFGAVMGVESAHHAGDRNGVDILVGPDQTYYLEANYGAFAAKLREDPPEKAERYMKHCRWINPPGHTVAN